MQEIFAQTFRKYETSKWKFYRSISHSLSLSLTHLSHRSVLITSSQKCDVCQGRLLSRAFYMFPCRHAFHRDCLTDIIVSTLSASQR